MRRGSTAIMHGPAILGALILMAVGSALAPAADAQEPRVRTPDYWPAPVGAGTEDATTTGTSGPDSGKAGASGGGTSSAQQSQSGGPDEAESGPDRNPAPPAPEGPHGVQPQRPDANSGG